MTGLNESVIAKAFGLPSEGQEFCDNTVLASGVDIENNRWFVITDGTVQRTAAQRALKPSLNRTKYFTYDDRVFEAISGSKFQMEVVRTNPSGGVQTVIGGSMSYTRVRKNPVSVADFRSEMKDMFVSDPRRDFKEYDSPKLHGEAFRDRLFTFVSYRGESYGWVKGGKIYHRRGSLIMPKLKVNKAVEGATVFYHTHPSKDEPSLSSADDYQFYADLAFAFGIKHFYTIMENRIDHFTFNVKKNKEEDYLKMDEDKLLDDFNAMIDEAEASVTKKHKGNENMTDEKFYETITRGAVSKMNSRFKQFFTITYKGHAKPGLVRENPGVAGFRHNPPVRISHIHRASQLDELRDTTNNYEHYGANEFGHSHYVYWWIDHHFSATPAHPKSRLWKLKEYGLSDEARRKLRAYMSEEVAPGYSKLDILLFLALYHDVGKKREKEEGRHHSIIGAEMFRDEISVELKLPEQVTDTVVHLMMTDVGRKNIDPEVFRTKAGDYLGVAYMLQLADMLAHHPFMYTSYAAEAKEQGLIDKANVHRYKQFAAEQHISNTTEFLNSRVINNPPPKASSAYYSGSFDTAIDGDIAQIEFDEWRNPDAGKADFFYNAQLRMQDPVFGTKVNLYLTSGKFIIYFGRASKRIEGDDTFYETAMDIYRRMGQILSNFTTGMDFESPPEPDIMVNPRHVDKVHLITISGPSGVGKSTIAKTLAGILDADLIPTVTTRSRRPSEKGNRDRVFIKEKQFKEMIEDGAFVEWKRLKNGFYYGRRYSDFKKPIAVIDVTLKGMKKYRDVFPHTTSIFLDPDVSPEELKKRILRRGGMTPEEAEARANIAAKQIEDAHKMDFDMFVKSKTGGFEDVAKQIADDIEIIKQNPPELLPVYDCETCGVKGMTHTNWYCKEHGEVKQNVPLYERSRRATPARLYHGTSARAVQSIFDSGELKPSQVSNKARVGSFMGEGVYLTPSGELAKAYAKRAAGMRKEDARILEIDIAGLERDNKHLVMRYMRAKHTSVLDKPADIYTVDSPIPTKYIKQVWSTEGAVPSPLAVGKAIAAISRTNPPISHYLNEVDRHYINRAKAQIKLLSPLYEHHGRVLGVFEIPLATKNADGTISMSQKIRVLMYARTGSGTRRKGPGYARKLMTEKQNDKYEMIAESPFLHNVAYKEWGMPEASDYSSLMWMPIWGEDIFGVLEDNVGWFIKPSVKHTFSKTGVPLTEPPFPSKDWEDKFERRWGHRTFFYAGIALSEMYPSPWSMARPFEGGGKAAVNLLAKKYGAILHKVASLKPNIPFDYEEEKRIQQLHSSLYPDDERAQLRQLMRSNPKEGPDLFSHFERWAKLVNMKNKELKAFLDSPLGKVAGLSPQEAKEQGIFSGRVSGRRILKMRAKIGLGGPKDYIKGPRHLEEKWEEALKKWTGPSKDYMKGTTDWDWCLRQVRFNERHGAFPYNSAAEERKGPLVRKQKTQNQVSRRLLSLWVWGHDPWRWARKHGIARMPKCPDVPWIGMTEKRKYGKVPVLMKSTKKNPPWSLEHQQNPYILLSEPWSGIEVPIDEMLAPLILHLWDNNVPTSYSDQGISRQGYLVIRWPYDYAKPIIDKLAKNKKVRIDDGGVKLWKGGDRVFPENSIAIRWKRGAKNLEAIYKAFGLKYPKSREDAEKMIADMSVEKNPQTGLPGIGDPPVDPTTIQPHLDWPRWPLPPWTKCKHAECKPHTRQLKQMVEQTDAVWKPPTKLNEGFYYIQQKDLNNILQSQTYLGGQEAHRQAKIAEAERIRAQHQGSVEDYRTNPPYYFLEIPAEKVRDFYAEALPRPLLMKTRSRRHHAQSMEELEGKMSPDMEYEAYKVARGDLPFFEQFRPLIAQTKEHLERVHGIGVEVVFVQEENNEINRRMNNQQWSSIGNIYFRETGDDFGGKDPFEPEGPPIKVTPFVSFDSGFMDAMANPSNIPFPVPEKYQEELERRLAEEMTQPGYRPHTIPEVIEEGLYDDSPSDFSYAQGEYDEFLEEIEKGDLDEAYAEYSDVEGHIAYWLYTNHRIVKPIYAQSHLAKTRGRIQIFKDLFAHYGYEHSASYLKGGSNYEKVFKVRAALDAAADAQGKPRITDSDEQLGAVVEQIVSARKGIVRNPSNDNSIDYPDSLDEAFDLMKRVAKRNRELEMTVGFDAWGWWKENKGIIDEKYGEDPVPGASWLMPVFDPDFDPYIDEYDPSMDDFHPDGAVNMHFYNQLMRIPQTEPPTPRKILQIALNIGQGQAIGIVDEDYTMSDFIAFDNPRKITPSYVRNHPTTLFVFGDNDQRRGKGGQAVIRDEPNAIGFRTKKAPRTSASAYYTDAEYQQNVAKMQADLDEISRRSVGYEKVHFIPGIGEGLAKLKEKAPRTYSWMKKNLPSNNPRTPGGKKFPTKYLKGLTAFEKMIAEDEIDKGYKYDADDPEAYKFWKSDIKATARGLKIGSSKHRTKYYKMYRKNIDKDYKPSGSSPKEKFLNRIRKETKIKRSILEKIYDKGLAAWRVGHRPGVAQHQWAAGRVYAFAVGADSSTGKGKPDHKLAVEAGVR